MDPQLKILLARRGQGSHAAETSEMDSELKTSSSHSALSDSELKVTPSHGARRGSERQVTSSHGVLNDTIPQEAFVVDSELKVTPRRRAHGLGAEGYLLARRA